MKVGELIKYLKTVDPELLVVVDGYEDGVDEAAEPRQVTLRLNVHIGKPYFGKHDIISPAEEGSVEAIFLSREEER